MSTREWRNGYSGVARVLGAGAIRERREKCLDCAPTRRGGKRTQLNYWLDTAASLTPMTRLGSRIKSGSKRLTPVEHVSGTRQGLVPVGCRRGNGASEGRTLRSDPTCRLQGSHGKGRQQREPHQTKHWHFCIKQF